MPIYEYECGKCKKVFEEIVFGQDNGVVCPDCQSKKVKKLVSSTCSLPSTNGGLDGCPAAPSGGCGSGGFS